MKICSLTCLLRASIQTQGTSLVAPQQRVCLSLPETQEVGVQPLSREGPLQMETATHSSILASKVPWTEEPGGLQSLESEESPPQLSD